MHDAAFAPPAPGRDVSTEILPVRHALTHEREDAQTCPDATMRMLIVDDDVTNGAVMKRMAMKVFGGDIDVETSAFGAVKACHERRYDLIVTDYIMPELNGLNLVSILRGFEEYKTTPILMASGSTDPTHFNRLVKHGLDCFITKPIDAEQFRKKIEYFLSKRPSTFAA
jgi:PleD family two-component response regulator